MRARAYAATLLIVSIASGCSAAGAPAPPPASEGASATVRALRAAWTKTTLVSGIRPYAVAYDEKLRIVYYVDGEDKIERYDLSTGTKMTPIGSGLITPSGLAVDSAAGDVYVSDLGHSAVRVYASSGADKGTVGSGFRQPYGLAYYSGLLFVADAAAPYIDVVTLSSGITTPLGGNLANARGVAVDADDGIIYVADTNNNAVKKFGLNGRYLGDVGGGFRMPYSVAVDSARTLFVADTFHNSVKRITAKGVVSVVYQDNGVFSPVGVAIDRSAPDSIFVADQGNAMLNVPGALYRFSP
jgi:DNA-binding beta-propeller fold protein YncE